MNALVRQADLVDAGPGTEPELVRRRFSVDDMEVMVRAGILNDDMRLELIGGDIVEMPAEGPLHQDWTVQLHCWLVEALGTRYAVRANTTLWLANEQGPSPDWCIYDRTLGAALVRGHNALLAIEQSDASIGRDLKTKASLYAAHGVRDCWVIDLNRERLHVHRDPGADGYGSVQVFEADESVDAMLMPGLSLRLADVPRIGPQGGPGIAEG